MMDEILVPLSDKEFYGVADLVYERFGIKLGEQKRALVAGRLSKRIRQLGLPSFDAYLNHVRTDSSGAEIVELINRITTNHSFFYREADHFEFLSSTIMPELKARLSADRSYPLRFWSAGCATGEEPYTLAMAITDSLGPLLPTTDWGILATDLSRAALEVAQRGTYPEARVQDLPRLWRSVYLKSIDAETLEVREEIRRSVLFKRLNLMNETFPFKGMFDVVFCRNVMIYFDAPVRKALVDRIHRYVKPGGYLFVGHSEALQREGCPFEYIRPAIYRKAAFG